MEATPDNNPINPEIKIASGYESIENDPNWEIIDISSVTPNEVEKIVEAGKATTREEHESLDNFMNQVTEGAFFDKRNLTHGVAGSSNMLKVDTFDVASAIMPNSHRGIYFMIGRNPFVNVNFPMMISSPFSPSGRNFFKEAVCRVDPAEAFRERYSKKGHSKEEFSATFEDGSFKGYNVLEGYGKFKATRNSPGTVLLHLANLPIAEPEILLPFRDSKVQYSWKDVFNTIVDLKQKKMFKRRLSEEEKVEIERDIEKYRNLLADEFGLKILEEH